LLIHLEQNAPGSHSSPQCAARTLQKFDIAGIRIGSHRRERGIDTL
jgi:hypothetical protein